jgi:hypothetical protein
MTCQFGSGLFVIPNQVLNLIQDLSISLSQFWVLEFRFQGPALWAGFFTQE